jgi:hypothetical protein
MNHNPPLIPRVSPYAVWYNLLKHNTLMLRSERRERLEAWAASDHRSLIVSTSSNKDRITNENRIRCRRFGCRRWPR